MNLGLPIPASTQESEDMTSCIGVTLTVVSDLLVANGTDVKRISQETVGILNNNIVANEPQGYC